MLCHRCSKRDLGEDHFALVSLHETTKSRAMAFKHLRGPQQFHMGIYSKACLHSILAGSGDGILSDFVSMNALGLPTASRIEEKLTKAALLIQS